MTNVETRREGNKLILTVDLTQTSGPSKSGKTLIVASTNGTLQIGEFSVGLNVWRSK